MLTDEELESISEYVSMMQMSYMSVEPYVARQLLDHIASITSHEQKEANTDA